MSGPPSVPGTSSLEALLDRIVRPDRPDDPAIAAPDGRLILTRAQLGERVRACAAAFDRAGLQPGDVVAFGVRQDAAGIAWLLGALRAGVALVILDPGLAPASFAARCRVAGVRAVVLDGLVASLAAWSPLRSLAAWRGVALPDPAALAPRVLVTGPALDRPGAGPRMERLDRLAAAGGDARRRLPAQAPAIVIFTSGTTGEPVGMVHARGGLAATLEQAAALVPLGQDDRVLGTGLHLVGPALLGGATVVMAPGRGGARALARTTSVGGVTHASLPLHVALAWAEAGAGTDQAVRTLLLGSAPVRNEGLRRLAGTLPGTRVASVYGLTEHLLVSLVEAEEHLAWDERKGDLVGPPLPGVRLRTDESGELQVGGPALAFGRLGEPGPAEWLPTGDLGGLDSAGRLILRGRRKEMLIRGGENIYPSLYESALAAAAGLEDALMVGVPRPDGDEAVVLFAVPRPGDDAEQARRRLARVAAATTGPLDAHARPDLVLAVRALPRAGRSRKADRQALAAIAARHPSFARNGGTAARRAR